MVGVAANRRKRGLRSSTANVGAIIGVGYITESASRLDLTVANTHLIHLNEEDFHQIFAEVLEAGLSGLACWSGNHDRHSRSLTR